MDGYGYFLQVTTSLQVSARGKSKLKRKMVPQKDYLADRAVRQYPPTNDE